MTEKSENSIFTEAMKDQAFVAALGNADTGEQARALLKTKGITIPESEIEDFLDEFCALPDEALDGVAGGFWKEFFNRFHFD